MTEQKRFTAFPIAMIGLISALLTTCGGIGSALVTSAVTVYQMERQQQQVALPASAQQFRRKRQMKTVNIKEI